MIKIFSPDKIIYLCNAKTGINQTKNAIIIAIASKDELRLKYHELAEKKDVQEIYFYNEDIKQLYEHFSSLFQIIEAAGGLVKNKNNEWLFIFRNGKWDLPKGKIEKGEGIKTAAVREVEEECGISQLTIKKELKSTFHIYYINDKAILKRTYWFKMDCADDSKLIPQTDEGITDVKWLPLIKLDQVYANTFESIKEVLKEL
jgi:8-oxo-dGTP pyrophosphatase MutT (NUDIX family)